MALVVSSPAHWGPPKGHWQHKAADLLVSTSSGNLKGFINETTPNVRQFLGVPFAQAPTGDLRWMPPTALPANQSSASVDATKFGLSCPQYESAIPSIYSTFVRELFINGPNGEDCLSLSIWAPLHMNPKEKLPVVIWIYGGGLQTGGSSVPYQDPAKWIERTQSHIVVSIQYRLNIFGFPNAPGLGAQNLGFMDQRAAVEWLRENIAVFGGNPEQMILWGQSAGGWSTDVYNYAYPDDPIVQGFICDSGNALLLIPVDDPSYTNFTFVASHFNCSSPSSSADDLLSCMRKVPATDIESFLKSYSDSQVAPAISFKAVVDDTIFFSNYTSRLLAGNVSSKSVIYGYNDIDSISLDPFPSDPLKEGANRTLADINFQKYICTTSAISRYRTDIGLKTYRFQYRGNFSNIAPLPWLGAYHSAELPLVFGTSGDFRGADTRLEKETSLAMQRAWGAFTRDPENGLERTGWGDSSEQGAEVFGGRSTYDETGENVAAQFISLAGLAESCPVK
ncbi:para-nitrobenzyl esterase protein [Rutstroemia sp. NJR-2017a BVV2]|nr:para-nitrobenzyl esterase protein [Rutstroemia sp. NJR-2017a BVV2]